MKIKTFVKYVAIIAITYLGIFGWLLADNKSNVEHRLNDIVEVRKDVKYVNAMKGIPKTRIRPGDGGRPYVVDHDTLRGYEMQAFSEGYTKFGFNKFASDRIPINRTLNDTNTKSCKSLWGLLLNEPQTYLGLPDMFISIVVKDVPKSILLRCISSILERTPEQQLKKIILLDDNSQLPETIAALEKLKAIEKIMVTRLPKTTNLRDAKMYAVYIHPARLSGVFVLLDPHVEVMHNWAEPILKFLKDEPRAIALPVMDTIDKHTLEYKPYNDVDYVDAFNWFFEPVKLRQETTHVDTISKLTMKVPTLSGFIAFRLKYMMEIGGGWDARFKTQELANIDLSFNSWLCGGGVYRISCSRVGHLHPAKQDEEPNINSLHEDEYRLAKVWSPGYIEHYCGRYGKTHCTVLQQRIGKSIESRLRKGPINAKCARDFSWYLQNVANMVYVPNKVKQCGQVVNQGFGVEMCLEHDHLKEQGMMRVAKCAEHGMQKSQYFMLTKFGTLRQDNGCVEYDGAIIQKKPCAPRAKSRNQRWAHKHGGLYHRVSRKCMVIRVGDRLEMDKCNFDDIVQRWTIKAAA